MAMRPAAGRGFRDCLKSDKGVIVKSKKVGESRVVMAQLMMPNDANHLGMVHGGTILSIADKVAYVAACRHAEALCVTACVDSVGFRSPIKVGQLVTFLASVNYVGRSSMEIGMKIMAEDLLTRKETHTNSCYFTLVALDNKGKPKQVPGLILETSDDKRRNEQAKERRAFRLRQLDKHS